MRKMRGGPPQKRWSRRALLSAGGVLVASALFARHGAFGDEGDDAMTTERGAVATYFPPLAGDAWETVSPAEAGWDAPKLEAALSFAEESSSTAMVILHGGRILAERYWQGWDLHRAAAIASCQKSVSALLAGIAQEEGLLRITDRVTDHLGPGWSRSPRSEDRITLRHLLSMTSGLNDRLTFEAEPGTVWYYNTPAYYRVKAVIERAAGVPLTEFTRDRLWSRAGMQDTAWVGDLLGPPPGQQLHSSARDMARFGLLVLNGGVWDGQAVIRDAAYLADALAPSQSLNPAYGYLWWLNGKERYVLPGRQGGGDGSFIPDAPPDMVSALGAGDKKIYVAPSMDLVVARHGDAAGMGRAEARSSFDNLLWQKLIAAAPR